MSSVSVIVPSYNYAHLLPGCIDSVLSQPGVEVEVLIIDDCSADDTEEVGHMLARDPRVSYRRHSKNQGHIATYNEGLDWASAHYVTLISADDLLTPGALRRATEALDDYESAGFVYGRSVYFETDDALPPVRLGPAQPTLWPGDEWIARRCRTATNCISSPEVVVRTAWQKRLGGYRADLPHAGDLEMWLRLAAHTDVVFLRHCDQAYYRRHPASMMRSVFSSKLTDLSQRKDAFDALFQRFGHRLNDPGRLQAQVHKALASEALWKASRSLDRFAEEPAVVEEFVDFAGATYPEMKRLSKYWGMRLRLALGPTWCPRVQWLLPGPYAAKARDILWWRHWREFGV